MTLLDQAHDFANGLGALITWELSSTSITPADLRVLLTSLGEDASIVPDIDPASAASRAAREYHAGTGNETRYRAEVVHQEKGVATVLGVLERRRVDASTVEWVQVDRVHVEINQGTLAALWTERSTDQAIALLGLVKKRATHLDADWIRPALVQKRLAEMGAFNLRRQGGVQFVARTYLEELARLARIVRSLGDSTFDVIHVAPTEESRASVSRAATMHLDEQIKDLVEKLDGWQEAAKAPRSDAVENLVLQIGEMTLLGEMYRDVLSVAMDGIGEKLAAVKARALTLIQHGVEEDAA